MAGAVVGVGAALSCSILAIVAAETMGFFRRGSQFAVDGRVRLMAMRTRMERVVELTFVI